MLLKFDENYKPTDSKTTNLMHKNISRHVLIINEISAKRKS